MGKKFSDEELYILEKFASSIQAEIERFKEDTKYLNLTEEQQMIHDGAIEILERKFEQLINAKNRKELKKVVNLKKILGEKSGEI